jgi:hypothetical protein
VEVGMLGHVLGGNNKLTSTVRLIPTFILRLSVWCLLVGILRERA